MVDAQKLLDEYKCAVQTLDRQWGDIRAIISGGFAPSRECADNFVQSMERLQKSYDAIQLAAREVISEQAADNCAVQTYVELIEQQQRENAECEKNRKILHHFISVKAVSSPFAAALKPYQQAATDLLEQTETPSETDLIGPSLFLSCLEMESLDGPEGEALLEQISALYPTKIYHGIMFKKYSLREPFAGRNEGGEEGDGSENASTEGHRSGAAERGSEKSGRI